MTVLCGLAHLKLYQITVQADAAHAAGQACELAYGQARLALSQASR